MHIQRFTIPVIRGILQRIALAGAVMVLGAAGPVTTIQAGSFFATDVFAEPDDVFHVHGYTGAGGELTVTLCIDPDSLNKTEMLTSIDNVVRTLNELAPTTGNIKLGAENNVPVGEFDFESTLLHEVDHCLGLGHTNNSTESGLSCLTSGFNCTVCDDCERDFTKSIEGVDTEFDLNDGADNVIGTSDDQRGDDINLNWFRKSNNNPFTIAATVDADTYSVDLGDLPGDEFSVSASRCVSNEVLGQCDTEAVMKQGTFSDEAQRTLGHDDVVMFRYARSGLDEDAGTGDDYTWTLDFIGETTDCDIVISIEPDVGFALCNSAATNISGPDHWRMVDGLAKFDSSVNWFFNDVSNSDCSVGENLVLDGENITTTEEFVACNTITVTNTTIAAGGDVTFRAGQRVILGEGFKVDGGLIDVEIDPTIN